MIFTERPKDFKETFEVVGCYLIHNDRLVLLHRHADKPQGGTWDTAGGKIHSPETVIDAVIREVKEETGVVLRAEKIEILGTFYVIYPDIRFIFHVSRYYFDTKPEIQIQPNEHTEFKWVTPREALSMPLIPDEDFCIKHFFKEYLQ